MVLQTNNSTALHLAAAGGHKEVAEVLLKAGALATDENAVIFALFDSLLIY